MRSKKKSAAAREQEYTGLRRVSLSETTLGLVNAVMLAGVAAHAQGTNPAPEGSQPTQLPEVVVQGEQDSYKPEAVASPRFTQPLREIPQTITVVPQAVIEERNATSLRDVLRNVSGISLQAGEGGGGLPGDNLSIRGFNARSDIFVDGVRDYGSYSRDPFNLEQVEVIKGPASTFVGRGSSGGAINLVTKTPRLNPFYGGSLGIGTDEYKRVTVDVNQPLAEAGLESAGFRLNGLWHENETPGRDVVNNKRWAVAPTVAFGIGKPTRLTLSYLHMDEDNIPDYGIPWVPANVNPALAEYSNEPAPVDFDNFYGLRHYDYEDIITDIVSATVEHDFSESLRLRNLSRFGRTDRDSAITAPRFVDVDTSTEIRRNLQRRQIEHTIYANQTDLNFDFETGPLDHALVTGLELSREEQDNRNSAQSANQPTTDFFDPNPNASPLGPMPDIANPWTRANAETIALYAYDTIDLTDKWQVGGGVRYDHIDTEFENDGRTDDLLSWRSGIAFKPLPNGSIYFGYGTSFNPSLEGNTGLTGNFLDVDPEESQNFELGTKWDLLQERLSLSAAVFRTEKTDARTPELGGTGNTVLEGEQVVDGFELGASGRITPDWQVFATYTFMDAEVEASNTAAEEGNFLGNTPDHSASFWTTYQLPWHLELGAGAQYVGERFNNAGANRRRAPDFWLFDAMLAYEVNENITLRLNVYNLADEDYIERLGGGHFIPGAGRSAVLTANLRY